MSDYGSYRYMGFWFQPDPVNIEQADTFGNNKFLEKYWSADTYTQMPQIVCPIYLKIILISILTLILIKIQIATIISVMMKF